MTSVSVLVAIGVCEDGYREILGACEGASESKECWRDFLVSLKERGLEGVRLFTSDKHLGFLESASEVFPDAKWQRCTVHFFRNLMTKIPRKKLAAVMPLLKATYAQEDKEATLKKVVDVEKKLRDMGLKSAADLYHNGVMETLTYLDFPHEHWRSIRTNNILERLKVNHMHYLYFKEFFHYCKTHYDNTDKNANQRKHTILYSKRNEPTHITFNYLKNIK